MRSYSNERENFVSADGDTEPAGFVDEPGVVGEFFVCDCLAICSY